MSGTEEPILPLSDLPVELERSKNAMIALIRNEDRLINRFDPESPKITPDIEKIMINAQADLVNALVETKDLTRGIEGGGRLSMHRRIIRGAVQILELQKELEQNETVRNYTGSHGHVLITLAGTVISHALELTRRFGINGVVADNLVEELTGASRPKIDSKRNGNAVKKSAATITP